MVESKSKKYLKSILVIVPYKNLYPPINGGMQRCFHVMHQLSLYFNVTAIVVQPTSTFLKCIEEYPSMSGIELYSTSEYVNKDMLHYLPFSDRIKMAIRYRWYTKKIRTITNAYYVDFYPLIVQLSRKKKFDALVIENAGMGFASGIVKKQQAGIKVLFDAHNVDSALAKKDFEQQRISVELLNKVVDGDKNLHKIFHGFFACSDADTATLLQMNENKFIGTTIPNGVVIKDKLCNIGVEKDIPESIIFCGSLDYPPNSEGLLWFYKNVWKKLLAAVPHLKLVVVGSGELPTELAPLQNDSAITFTGRVENVQPYYNEVAIAIVPLFTGSGTRLKVLEAMGLGVPVVSTSKGAEGIDYTDTENILIGDDAVTFEAAVTSLLQNKEARMQLQQNAFTLVKQHYDWNIIGKKLKGFVDSFLSE